MKRLWNGLRSARWPVVAMALALPCACQDDERDGDDDEITPEVVAAYEGIYEITTWTDDDSGCEGAGADQLATATERHFVIAGGELFGLQLLETVSCPDVATCLAIADAVHEGQPYGFIWQATLSERRGPEELWGLSATTGVERNGLCVEREYEDHLLTGPAGAVTLTSIRKRLPDRSPEDGFCVVGGREAVEEAEDLPCTGQRVVSGTRIMEL